MVLKIKKLKSSAKLPFCATCGSAGYDLFACIGEEIRIMPGESMPIPTGIAAELENTDGDHALMIFARSSLACKHGIAPANCVGVVDTDYRGEIVVFLHNHSSSAYTVRPNDRIAQLIVMPVCKPEIVQSDSLSDTDRGTGGFGSTAR